MSPAKIDVFCPECKTKLAVPTSALGKQGKCPHCRNVFPLAMPAQRPGAPASPLSPLTPLSPAAYAAPALAPLAGPGLTPLSDAGLTPLPASN